MHNHALMARFNAWVNGHIFGVVATLPEDEYHRERGLFFGSLHRTLDHLLLVDHLWMARIEGRQHGFRSLDQRLHADLAALRTARLETDQALIQLVDRLAPEGFETPVTYRALTSPGELTVTRNEILLALFNHQTHHRGQVSAVLTQLGYRYPDLDLPYFVAEQQQGRAANR